MKRSISPWFGLALIFVLLAIVIIGDCHTDEAAASGYGNGPGPTGSTGATGAAGAAGTNGTDGLDGTDGADGKTWLSGSGAPGDGTGVNGDFYLDTAASAWYGPKASGTWAGTGPNSLIGATGATGATGDTGATGAAGAAGAAGADGFDGCDITVCASGCDVTTPAAATPGENDVACVDAGSYTNGADWNWGTAGVHWKMTGPVAVTLATATSVDCTAKTYVTGPSLTLIGDMTAATNNTGGVFDHGCELHSRSIPITLENTGSNAGTMYGQWYSTGAATTGSDFWVRFTPGYSFTTTARMDLVYLDDADRMNFRVDADSIVFTNPGANLDILSISSTSTNLTFETNIFSGNSTTGNYVGCITATSAGSRGSGVAADCDRAEATVSGTGASWDFGT